MTFSDYVYGFGREALFDLAFRHVYEFTRREYILCILIILKWRPKGMEFSLGLRGILFCFLFSHISFLYNLSVFCPPFHSTYCVSIAGVTLVTVFFSFSFTSHAFRSFFSPLTCILHRIQAASSQALARIVVFTALGRAHYSQGSTVVKRRKDKKTDRTTKRQNATTK